MDGDDEFESDDAGDSEDDDVGGGTDNDDDELEIDGLPDAEIAGDKSNEAKNDELEEEDSGGIEFAREDDEC